MSHPLTRAQREMLAQVLREREQVVRAQLQGHQQGRSQAEKALAAREQDGDDAKQLASDQEIGVALTNRERQELAALAAAMQRLNEADYGLCVDCGKRIPFERLIIEPQALRCVACESKRETRKTG
ncbi:MAG: TraR/DksA C4-type zinc finger protein [Betaproteobacteria bacterium]|nr:TraR/DksA C4-type zinc finger protein [Betaproteobacteria bacterium]